MSARPICLLIILASLFLLTFQQRAYSHDFGFEMLRAASAAGCPVETLRDMSCGPVCKDLSGYSLHYRFEANSSASESYSYSMLVNPSARRFVVTFRGTRGVNQLLQEFLHSRSVSYQLHNVSNAVATEYFYVNYVKYVRNDFMKRFKAAIDSHPDYQFYIVGHSLGGAFASLAVIDIRKSDLIDKNAISLFTFGSPRVGCANLAKAIADSVSEIFRITHRRDVVPHLPPTFIFNAFHVGTEIFYDGTDGKSFKVCKGNEDPTCSNKYSVFLGSTDDHRSYLGVSTRCFGVGI